MKKLFSFLLAFLMLLSLCACGASGRAANANPSYDSMSSPAEAPATAEFAADTSSYGGLAAGSPANTEVSEGDPEKIIYSSDVTVETTAFDRTLENLGSLVKEYGGWVEASSISGANYYDQSRGYPGRRSASYSLRIPSDKFSDLMNSLSILGNIPYSHTYTENITAQYYDVEARLTAYTTQETRLLEMMEKAATVSDVIAIEERLTELRYQIESLQSALKNWDRQVSCSSVALSIEEVREYTPETHISYGRELWQALTNGFKTVGNFFKDLLVIIVGALPALVVIAVLAVILVPAAKKKLTARKARKTAKKASKDPET